MVETSVGTTFYLLPKTMSRSEPKLFHNNECRASKIKDYIFEC